MAALRVWEISALFLIAGTAGAGQTPLAVAQAADSRCLLDAVYASPVFAPNEEDNRKVADACITAEKGMAGWYIKGQSPESQSVDPESEKAQQLLLRLRKYAVQQVIQIRYTCTSRQIEKTECASLLKLK